MPTILSKSAFAARRGVATSAVSNWIARGKIYGAALTAGGKIDVEEAERQLGQTVDPGRGAPALDLTARASIIVPEAAAIVDSAKETLAELRIRRERLAIEQQEQAAAIAKGALAPTAELERLYGAKLANMLAAIEQLFLDLPAKLGAGRDGIDIARRELRAFRERFAAQEAAALELADAA